jgi:hypothetical protein
MNNNNLNMFVQISPKSITGQLLFVLLTLIVVALLITGVVVLIQMARQCLEHTGYYEPFAPSAVPENYASQLQERIQQVKQANLDLDAGIEIFTENTQNTCEVYTQIEDMYVENKGTPQSESEYQLPKDALNKLLERRRHSAKKQFQDSRTLFGQSRNAPVHECFANPTPESSLEDELRNEVTMLVTKRNNLVECGIGKKYMSLESLISFNTTHISNTAKDIANATKPAAVVEGYETPNNNAALMCDMKETKTDKQVNKLQDEIQALSGTELLNRAATEIQNAAGFLNVLQAQKSVVGKQMETMEEMKQSASQLNNL